jgi:hypothetical protein
MSYFSDTSFYEELGISFELPNHQRRTLHPPILEFGNLVFRCEARTGPLG